MLITLHAVSPTPNLSVGLHRACWVDNESVVVPPDHKGLRIDMKSKPRLALEMENVAQVLYAVTNGHIILRPAWLWKA